jgi:hypothetical protein
MSEPPLDTHRSYLIKHTTRTIRANVEKVLGRVDLDELREEPADELQLNDIGRLVISTNQPLFFDPYEQNRDAGAFVLIDALSNNTVGACMIVGAVEDSAGSESADDSRSATAIPLVERRARLGHAPVVIAYEHQAADAAERQAELSRNLERALFDAGLHTTIVDVRRLSEGTRSPALLTDVVSQCVAAGLVTILSTGLPRVAQRRELEKRLGGALVWVTQEAEDDVLKLKKWVLEHLDRD